MRNWILNPTARVTLEPKPALLVEAAQSTILEPLDAADRVEGLYHLATLAPDELDALVKRGLSQGDPTIQALIDSHVVVEATEAPVAERGSRETAFALDNFRAMQAAAYAARPRARDAVTMIDNVLPEDTRFSIDVWSRGLPYRRIDVDRPDAPDLHWIHALMPCSIQVRAAPFLRILDTVVRGQVPWSLRIMRAYLYAGQGSDVYRTHTDSEEPQDVTAIYYPARWRDHWGGELIFYDDGEPRWAVAPRGNRLVVFHGSRPHRISPVGIAAEAARCSLVLRYGADLTAEDRDDARD